MSAQRPGARALAAAARALARAVLPARRRYADVPRTDAAAGQIVVQGSGDERLRVRRARLEDAPRALRLVRRQLRDAPLPNAAHLLIADLIAQTLAQGQSLVAEVNASGAAAEEALRGLALCAALWPWDAAQLERQARCVRCARSRRLLQLAAHCLRAPDLHRKYEVGALLQVTLVVPPEFGEREATARLLATRVLQRAEHLAFPLVRFDVADPHFAKMLEDLKLTKEWELHFDLTSDTEVGPGRQPTAPSCANFIAVYCSKLAPPENT